MEDRIFVAIGVSRPSGGLAQLPGAISAAKRMAEWARANGYRTLLIHDDAYPKVTVQLLRKEIGAAINEITNEVALKRVVIFFAGHGAALAVGDQYWVLSDWDQDSNEAISVTALQRILEYYGPRQVAMIGDACQDFSSRFIDLRGSAVLLKPNEDPRTFELDQFYAVDTGQQAFMIKATGEVGDFCLFSEVLLDALEGDAEGDFFDETKSGRSVTSQSLARYIETNVPKEAGKYGLRMTPRPRPGFYTDPVYRVIPPAPAIAPANAPPPEEEDLGPNGGAPGLPGGGFILHDGVIDVGDGDAPAIGPAPAANTPIEPRSRSVRKLELEPLLLTKSYGQPRFPRSRRVMTRVSEKLKASVRSASFSRRFDDVGHWSYLHVTGADVSGVSVSSGELIRLEEDSDAYAVSYPKGIPYGLQWSEALVLLEDGRTVPVCLICGFVAFLHALDSGEISLFHSHASSADYLLNSLPNKPSSAEKVVELLVRAGSGELDLKTTIDTAVELRNQKHEIITLGCVAAQFYDAIRDVDSLRSMAAFYYAHRQPVPLDIILYGGGRISEHDGHLYADIPAVSRRDPRTESEADSPFAVQATQAIQRHPIAGRVPWLRRAWSAVATANCDSSAEAWREQALAVLDDLDGGMFTVVRAEGRDRILELSRIAVPAADAEELEMTV